MKGILKTVLILCFLQLAFSSHSVNLCTDCVSLRVNAKQWTYCGGDNAIDFTTDTCLTVPVNYYGNKSSIVPSVGQSLQIISTSNSSWTWAVYTDNNCAKKVSLVNPSCSATTCCDINITVNGTAYSTFIVDPSNTGVSLFNPALTLLVGALLFLNSLL
jgi:hypothetical protein